MSKKEVFESDVEVINHNDPDRDCFGSNEKNDLIKHHSSNPLLNCDEKFISFANSDVQSAIDNILGFRSAKDVFSVNSSKQNSDMTLTERIRVSWTPELSQICHKANNIYNFANLLCRKIFFLEKKNPNVSYEDFLEIKMSIMPDKSIKNYLEKKTKLIEAFDELKKAIRYQGSVYSKFRKNPTKIGNLLSTIIKYSKFALDLESSPSVQLICRDLGKNWFVYFKNLKKFYDGDKDILGKPNIPRFRKKDKNYEFTMFYTGQIIKSKEFMINIGETTRTVRYRKYSKTTAILILPRRHRDVLAPIRVRYEVLQNLRQVRIIPHGTEYEIEIVYNKPIKKLKLDKKRFFAIDLNIDPHMALVANFKFQPLLISSSPLKQANYILNSKMPRLQSKKNVYQEILKIINKSGVKSFISIKKIIEKKILVSENNYSWKKDILKAISSNPKLEYDRYLRHKNLSKSDKTSKFFGYVRKLPSIDNVNKFLQYHKTEFKARDKMYRNLIKNLNGKLEPVQFIKDLIDIINESITKLYNWYRRKSWDAVHKLTRKFINLCKENNVGTGILGYNKGWKQNSKLSKAINRRFVSIPFYKLKKYIKYKAKLCGIKIHVVKEWYTSKCSAVDREPIQKRKIYDGIRCPVILGQDGKKHCHKGLFYSKKLSNALKRRILIHGDINGAYNIGRIGARQYFENIPIEWMLKPPVRVTV